MALNLGALPYFMQYEQQAQQMAQQKQEAQMRMQAFQQAQQDRQRQQAAMQAAGMALPQLMAQPQMQNPAPQFAPPPPQPPMPGQASQPMVQPGQMPPQGQMPAPPAQQQQAPQPPQPFRPMPTAPAPQAAGPASIPPPPAAPQAPQLPAAGLTLSGAVDALRAQGLDGADLMAGLGQLMPVLDAQSKAQAAQLQAHFNNEVKLAQIEDRRAALEERKAEADQRAKDRTLDREARLQAHADSLAIQRESLALRRESLQARTAVDPNAALSKDDMQLMAEQYLAGDKSVFQNLGRGAQGSKNVVALRGEIMRQAKERGLNGADIAAGMVQYAGETAGARTSATKAANVALAAGEAGKTIGIARELSGQLPRGDFVPVNRALQSWQTNTGDPKVIAFGAALNTVVNAYARAISPSGTPTVSDKEHARQLLSTANSKAQFDAVMNVMEQEMAAARQAPAEVQAEQRARMTGKPAPGHGTGAAPALPAGWTVKEH